jgi:NTE family protein
MIRRIFVFLTALILIFTSVSFANPKLELPSGVSETRLAVEAVWPHIVLSRPSDRPRVVLVLGGGGARGLSHIGVLRVFEEERIPIDEIVGVSVGALIGALYAGGMDTDQIEKMAGNVGWSQLTNVSRFRFFRLFMSDDMLSTAKMETYLKKHIGDLTFSELKIPFSCVATDIRSGQRVVFQNGPVAIAARASATIPGMFQPVEYEHQFLVDGGLVDNLPTDIVHKSDTDVIVGVLPKADEYSRDVSTVLKVLIRSIEIQKDVIINERKKTADFLIEPNLGSMSLADLAQADRAIEIGTQEARKTALDLKKLILSKMVQKESLQETRKR